MPLDWIEIKELKERLNEVIIPFDELAALVGGVAMYIQIKPDQKEFLDTAIEKLKRQRQACMNIVTQGTLVNASIKEMVLTKKEIDEISRAFSMHKTATDNIEWGKRANKISDHLLDMNTTFKKMVRAILDEELKDEEE